MYGRQKIEALITDILSNAYKKAAGEAPAFSVQIEVPKDVKFGDFSSNIAMQHAKKAGMPPRALAEEIVANADISGGYIEKIEIAGPGFINLHLNDTWLYEEAALILSLADGYGKMQPDKPKRINVEFVSANPTGPLHIGNARGGAVGDVLANVYAWAGWQCEKEFYLNDAGNQIVKFGQSLSARYMQLFDEGYPFPEDGYCGDDLKRIVSDYYDIFSDKLRTADEAARAAELTDFGLKINTDNMQNVLKEYGITYDTWFRESDLHNSDAIEKTVAILKENGATYESDGALWFRATDYGCEKDEVLVRQNGIPTYYLADIAYHYNKLAVRKFDLAIDVWGADHHGHVQRMKMGLKAAGIAPERLQVVLMQLVHLVRGDEAVRMSKRKGEIVTLDELIGEVSVDAARFIFNSYAPSTHMDFDMDLAVRQSNENPVFYVQYAYARMCSILRGFTPERTQPDFSLLAEKQELALLRKMADFSTEIALSAEELDPSRMTRYAYDLASLFHSFYNACRVKSDDESLACARYHLLKACSYVLKNTLAILGVHAPEQM
jgi:arginyl-tRNA synthetase